MPHWRTRLVAPATLLLLLPLSLVGGWLQQGFHSFYLDW
jgi:hypothetical protein